MRPYVNNQDVCDDEAACSLGCAENSDFNCVCNILISPSGNLATGGDQTFFERESRLSRRSLVRIDAGAVDPTDKF